MSRGLLVAGIGNIFLGDDGFGVAVVRLLQQCPLPAAVEVKDFGIRGMDLAFALEDCEAAILVDVVSYGGAPGTLYVLEPRADHDVAYVEMHSMTPDRALALVDHAPRARLLRLVGCQPATFGPDGIGQEGLSPAVEAAVGEAVQIVRELIDDLLDKGGSHA